MKLSTTIKAGCAAVALAAAGAASATPFYLDVGANYSSTGVKAGGPNTTGEIQALTDTYRSTTIITDNGNGIFGAGDTVVGSGGLLKTASTLDGVALGGGITERITNTYPQNYITGLTPARGSLFDPTGPAGNGFGTNWGLSFGWDNLTGVVNSTGGIVYNSGIIHIYLVDATHVPGASGGVGTALEIGLLHVTGGGNNAIGQSLNLVGWMESVAPEHFYWMDGTAFSSTALMEIKFGANQNTEPFFVNGSTTPNVPINACFYFDNCVIDPITGAPSGTYRRAGELSGIHDGSISFNVPEPGSLALLGLGFLGLAARRRKA